MVEESKDDLNVGEVFINSSSLTESQIKALDQLLKFQCLRMQRKLDSLQLKRKSLSEGKDIRVSLNELISKEIVEAAEILTTSNEDISSSFEEFGSDLNKVQDEGITKPQEEITRIIESINSREKTKKKQVKFAESDGEESENDSNESGEGKDEFFTRKKKRSSTVPNPNDKLNLSGEVQLILHSKGTCKPCAFVYNKKKTCRNGPNCGFCHHEDHALCTVKRWKKQQKLVTVLKDLVMNFQTGSLTAENIPEFTRSHSELS